MNCKNHPNRQASKFCASCNIPICDDCAEEVNPGQFFCFNCAMLQTVSSVGSSLVDKKKKAREKKLVKKKEWGPFNYFVLVSSVLIVVMWGVILFGGRKAPGTAIDYGKQDRVFLFMVDNAIIRYHHYEGGHYPDNLVSLAPKYLPMANKDLHYLNNLSYVKDASVGGYSLSLAHPKPGTLSITISPRGIKYQQIVKKGGTQ